MYSNSRKSRGSQASRGSRRKQTNNGFQSNGLMITGKNMTVVPLSEINRMKNMVKDDTDPYKEHLK